MANFITLGLNWRNWRVVAVLDWIRVLRFRLFADGLADSDFADFHSDFAK
ncbi:MAG: hypothetical protein LBL93_00625 [Ruminococcus sp.]|nr:hypothetical protein [Ruminococcus sp.]